MKNILYIIALAITITFSSCSTETSFYDTLSEEQLQAATGFVPDDAGFQELLGPAYSKLTVELGVNLNEGDNPPDLNGFYFIFPVEVTADLNPDPDFPVPYDIPNVFIEILLSGQNGLTIDYQGVFWDTGDDGVPGGIDDAELFRETNADLFEDTYLSGDANTGLFTIFATVLSQGDPSPGVDVIAISGQRTATGIDNLEYGYVSLDGIEDTSPIIGGQTYSDKDKES
jgi:hypothetical protein